MSGPYRLCCGQQHDGVLCPDGLVMCCHCFERFTPEELATDPVDGKKVDVCLACAADDACDHVGTGRIKKFDGGRLPILCERCYTIVGWDR